MLKRKPGRDRRLLRRVARHRLFPAVELLWRWLFSLAGFVLRPQARPLAPCGRDSVLVLAPHPDDETIGCGGTIALHALSGDRVTVCVITNGGQSRAAGLSKPEMVARRHLESQEAMARLGDIELIQLGLPEGAWQDAALIRELIALLQRVQPEIIYTTSPVDYHPDHIRVAHCLSNALQRAHKGSKPILRLYEVQVPLTPLLANRVAHISDVASLKWVALSAYRTQDSVLGWLPRLSAYQQRLYRASGPVEVFSELTVDQFIAFVGAERGRAASYRGIRPRPLTDPAAWLVGTRSRLRLRRVLSPTRD